MEAVTFKAVEKYYPDGTCAVQDLNLEIDEGEFLVLVGPSGCGKSTALRMVAGLEEISGGSIYIGDKPVNELQPQDRDVAMIFQNYALYPHMDIFENIAFPLRARGFPKDEITRRVTTTAHRLGLGDMLKRNPGRLSGRQRQRVAMARAMVREPRVFLMDEPLSNLDAKLRVQMRAEVSHLQHELGVTTIYVTHDQTEAMTMGSRIAVMRKGVLQQLGKPQDLYDRPCNLFVATFIGSPAMNLFQVTLEDRGGALHCVLGDQSFALPESALADFPTLRQRTGGEVALGVRPEHLVDPRRRSPDLPRLKGRTVVVESLGSEKLVQLEFTGRPVASSDVLEVSRDIDETASGRISSQAAGGTVRAIGRFDPKTDVGWDEEVEVSVDTDCLHFFDLETGATLRDG